MGRHDFEVDLQALASAAKNMPEDVEESGGRLGKIVMNYLEYEQSASKPLEKLEGEFASLKIHGA